MPSTSTLRLRIFDGSRQLFSKPASFLIRIVDGNQRQHIWKEFPQNDLTFTNLPFYDNLFDNYTVLVSADGYKQAGYQPVKPRGVERRCVRSLGDVEHGRDLLKKVRGAGLPAAGVTLANPARPMNPVTVDG